jgi:hypothetical protein
MSPRKLVEIANDVEAVMDGRIYIERGQRTARAVLRSGERLLQWLTMSCVSRH